MSQPDVTHLTEKLSRERLQDVALWRTLQQDLRLSDREIQVAIRIVLGDTISAIARRLGIGPGTVVTYYRRLKRKAHALHRAELIAKLLLASGLLLQDGTR